jgi:hypothetical protein
MRTGVSARDASARYTPLLMAAIEYQNKTRVRVLYGFIYPMPGPGGL